MHPLCIIEVGLDMWTFTGYLFLTFCCKLSESLTHHGSRFLEGEAENYRKPDFRCESGAGPNMQWHGTTWLRFWMVQTHDSQKNRVWPENHFCAISIHVSVISLPNLHCQPYHGKASNLYTVLVYIRHGVRAGWPSSTSHTAPQEEVKRLLEEFAAYTLANAKAEVRNADSHVVHRRFFSRKLQIQTNSGS